MRALSALDARMYALRARQVLVKVFIDGTDITALNGTDWLEDLTYGGGLDSPLTTCDLKVRRDDEMFSLSPLNAQSKLNLGGVVIDLNKLVVVQTAIVPEGVGREFADLYGAWTEVWRGRIDTWDESTNPMVVKCRDISCEVADLFIEKLKCYAVGKMAKGTNVWYAGMYAKLGDLIVPSSQPELGADYTRVYRCTNAGTTGNTEPTWPDDGSTVDDGTADWVKEDTTPAAWQANTLYLLGQTVTAVPDDGHRYFCIPLNGEASGTSGNSQPIWPASLAGASFADGTVKWILLPDNSDGGIAVENILAGMLKDHAIDLGVQVPYVWTPTTPGYWRNPFYVQQQSLLEAMRLLAQEIGWDVRLKFNPNATAALNWGYWRLCFSLPDRAKAVADLSLTSDEYSELPRVESSVQTVRNVIAAAYCNSTFTFQDGTPLREWYQEEDAASIAKYGRRYMGISCSLTNFVNTYAEAQAVVRACLADLKDPLIDTEVLGPYRWNVEFGDLVALSGNWVHFTGEQKLAVYGFQHTLTNKGACTTRLTLRGKPSIGVMRWHAMGVGPGQSKGVHGRKPAGAAKGSVVVAHTPTGAKVKFDPPTAIDGPPVGPPGPGQWAETELHLYTAPKTPDELGPTTLAKRQGRCSTFDVTGLTAKTKLYGRVVLIDGLGQRAPPSEEFEVTPRQNLLGEIDDGLKVACMVRMTNGQSQDLTVEGPYQGAGHITLYNDVLFDDGEAWDNVNHYWVCPVSGVYRFEMTAWPRYVPPGDSPPDPVEFNAWGQVRPHVLAFLSVNVYPQGASAGSGGGVGPYAPISFSGNIGGSYLYAAGIALLEAGDIVKPFVNFWSSDAGAAEDIDIRVQAFAPFFFHAQRVWSR